MKGEGKKLRPIRYGPFTIFSKIRDNAFHLMLYEPPLIMDIEEVAQIPAVDDFSPEYLDELPEDIILDRKTITSQ